MRKSPHWQSPSDERWGPKTAAQPAALYRPSTVGSIYMNSLSSSEALSACVCACVCMYICEEGIHADTGCIFNLCAALGHSDLATGWL